MLFLVLREDKSTVEGVPERVGLGRRCCKKYGKIGLYCFCDLLARSIVRCVIAAAGAKRCEKADQPQFRTQVLQFVPDLEI